MHKGFCTFEDYLEDFHGYDRNDIEHLLSSDELEELHEMYEDHILNA